MNQSINPVPVSYINRRCGALWQQLWDNAPALGLARCALPCGAQLLDAGMSAPGSLEAGRLITELAQGGLARAALSMGAVGGKPLPVITVESLQPCAAALSLQMGCFVGGLMLSGPVRLLLEKPEYVAVDAPRESMESLAVAVLQSDGPVEERWVLDLARAAQVPPRALRLVAAPMHSVAGCTQIAGRMNENVILTLVRSLGYPAARVRHILGASPVCPVYKGPGKVLLPDDLLHYRGEAFLTLAAAPGDDVAALAHNLCFESLPIFGTLFADLLDAAGGDFFQIPNISHINKLARVTINDITGGKVACAGAFREDVLLPYLEGGPA